ncbi:MAG: hypothetical protein KGO50_15205 [Myxococcales bacterium]|nr:hypothetical protein [Myxococcales bacterium]
MMTEPVVVLHRDAAGLPPRIQQLVADLCRSHGDFVAALKTAVKPNPTIPLIWLVVLQRGLLACNTHRTRGIWRFLDSKAIDECRLEQTLVGFFRLVVFTDTESPLIFDLPASVEERQAREFLRLTQPLWTRRDE